MPWTRRERIANPPQLPVAPAIIPVHCTPFERMENPPRPLVAALTTSSARSVVSSVIYIILLSIWQ